MKAKRQIRKNFHEFAIEDKTFEKESKEILNEIEIKTSEKKIKPDSKNTLFKIINFLLSLEFFKSISSKIPNPKDFKSKDDFVNKSMEIIVKEFTEKTNK